MIDSDGRHVGNNVASSAADLFAANDRPIIRYPVEEWDGLVVCLRAPSMATVLAITELEPVALVLALFEAALVDPDGAPLLDADGVEKLFAEKSPTAIGEITQKLHEISGLSEDAEATAEGN